MKGEITQFRRIFHSFIHTTFTLLYFTLLHPFNICIVAAQGVLQLVGFVQEGLSPRDLCQRDSSHYPFLILYNSFFNSKTFTLLISNYQNEIELGNQTINECVHLHENISQLITSTHATLNGTENKIKVSSVYNKNQ